MTADKRILKRVVPVTRESTYWFQSQLFNLGARWLGFKNPEYKDYERFIVIDETGQMDQFTDQKFRSHKDYLKNGYKMLYWDELVSYKVNLKKLIKMYGLTQALFNRAQFYEGLLEIYRNRPKKSYIFKQRLYYNLGNLLLYKSIKLALKHR